MVFQRASNNVMICRMDGVENEPHTHRGADRKRKFIDIQLVFYVTKNALESRFREQIVIVPDTL